MFRFVSFYFIFYFIFTLFYFIIIIFFFPAMNTFYNLNTKFCTNTRISYRLQPLILYIRTPPFRTPNFLLITFKLIGNMNFHFFFFIFFFVLLLLLLLQFTTLSLKSSTTFKRQRTWANVVRLDFSFFSKLREIAKKKFQQFYF